MSVYDPYSGRYSLYNPGLYNQGLYNQGLYNQGLYRSPSARSYYPYAASAQYSAYTNATSDYYARSMTGGAVSERIYFSFDGKLIRSYKIRNYRRAQKHVLDLYPEILKGVASSRIQFFVTRAGYSGGQYVGFKSYISKHTWASEVDGLAEHDTVGIEIRPSISFTESVSSFFNRSRLL